MRLRELYQEGAITRTLLTNRVLDLFALYNIARPVTQAYSNIKSVESQYQQKQVSLSQRDQKIDHELSQCAAQIAATLVGSSLLKNVGQVFLRFFPGWFLKELGDLGVAIGQGAYMNWINSDQGRDLIGRWLTGQAFQQFGVIKDSGPLFDKYIGSGLKKSLEDANTWAKTAGSELVNKAKTAAGIPTQDPQASKEIGQTSTPKQAQPVQVRSTPTADIEYNPETPDDPYRVNIKRGAF